MRYLNFDLRLEPEGGGVRALALDSPAGEAEGVSAAAPSPDSARALLARLGLAEPPVAPAERFDTPEDLGAALYAAAFPGAVGVCLVRSRDQAAREGAGLRIRMRLDVALAALPWELVYDADAGAFLALSAGTPVLRYEELPAPPPAPSRARPLRALAMLASPAGMPPLDAEREWRALERAFAGADPQALAPPERVAPTLEALQQRLRRGGAHALHLVAHGALDAATGRGAVALEDLSGDAQPVGGDQLAALLRDAPDLRLVVLQACESAATSGAPLSGVARRLVRQGLPAVIAMQTPVSTEAARLMAHELYRALADGAPIEAALAEARKAAFARLGGAEWAAPALFLRADGALWEAQAEAGAAAPAGETPWWQQMGVHAADDVIFAQIGAGASGVAVGEGITQYNQLLGPPTADDRQLVEAALDRVAQELARLAGAEAGKLPLAQFQLTMLRGELVKTGAADAPSAAAIVQAGGGLLDTLPALRPALAALFAAPAAGRVVTRAGESAVAWVRQRFG